MADSLVAMKSRSGSRVPPHLMPVSENDTSLHAWEQFEGSIRMSTMFGGYERGMRNMYVARQFKLVDTSEAGDSAAVSAEISEHMSIAAEPPMGS